MAQPAGPCIPEDTAEKVQGFLDRITTMGDNYGEAIRGSNDFMGQVRGRIEGLRPRIAAILQKLNEINALIVVKTRERDEAVQQMGQIQAQLQQRQAEFDQAVRERAEALQRVQQLEQEVQAAQGREQGLQQNLADAQQRLQDCENRIADCTQRIQAHLALVNQCEDRILRNENSLAGLRNQTATANGQIQRALEGLENSLGPDFDAVLAGNPGPGPGPGPGPEPGPGGAGGNAGGGPGPLIPPSPPGTPRDDDFGTPREFPEHIPEDAPVVLGGQQMTLRDAMRQITDKNRQMVAHGQPDNKFSQALNRIRTARDEAEINQILSSSGFKFNQLTRALQGGKTKKRNRGKKGKKSKMQKKSKKTQRGGYRAVYRRRITRKTSSN